MAWLSPLVTTAVAFNAGTSPTAGVQSKPSAPGTPLNSLPLPPLPSPLPPPLLWFAPPLLPALPPESPVPPPEAGPPPLWPALPPEFAPPLFVAPPLPSGSVFSLLLHATKAKTSDNEEASASVLWDFEGRYI